jgi:acetate kinase
VTALLGDAFTFHPEDVSAIGHRVVHGGNKFSSSVVITPAVIAEIEALSVFAPLHNPVNVAGIRVAMKHVPERAPGCCLRHRLPPDAAALRLPLRPALRPLQAARHPPLRLPWHLAPLRFPEAAEVLKRPLGELEIVSCHLGIGASLCAIDHGRSVDTTMGMTPTDGLIMPSRSGSIDPAVMIHLMEQHRACRRSSYPP